MTDKPRLYQPLRFIAITFAVTWVCAYTLAYQAWFDYSTVPGAFLLTFVSILESASPLIAALLLMRRPLFRDRLLARFLFGPRAGKVSYLIVALLFAYQFLTFYLFRADGDAVPIAAFAGAWLGQILLGGGMEEGGWRGYLQPALEQKMHITAAVLVVGLIWALWHLPYFFLSNTFHTGSNFLFYLITTTATAFTLTAIYQLTESVLLCTLFHGWQNAIVMNFQADMSHPGFLIMFLIQTIGSILLCVRPPRRSGVWRTHKHKEAVDNEQSLQTGRE